MDSFYLPAIKKYCAYQERCHAEVRSKLYELGADAIEVETIICELIEKDIINEERFARTYARGKFKMKKWGRNKIKYHLRLLKLSEQCIQNGLKEIDGDEYYNVLVKLATKKNDELKGERKNIKEYKTKRYLIQKGYEHDIIKDVLDIVNHKHSIEQDKLK